MLRKIVLLTFAVAAILGGAFFCLSWYLQAQGAKQTVADFIARLNADAPYITYQSIDTTGFPTRVSVRINQPKFSGRVDTLLKTLQPSLEESAASDPRNAQLLADIRALPEWTEELAWAGSITYSVSMLSDSYSFSVEGPVTQTGNIAGSTVTLISQPSMPSSCTLSLERSVGGLSGGLWDTARLLRDPQSAFRDFKALSCNVAPYTITEDTSKAVYMSSAGADVTLSNIVNTLAGTRTFHLSSSVKDQEYKPESDVFIRRYVALFPAFLGNAALYNLSEYGKQNLEFALEVTGPQDYEQFSTDSSFSIRIPRARISTAMGESTLLLALENTVNNDQRSIALVLNNDNHYTEAFDRYLAAYARAAVEEIKHSPDPELAAIRAAFEPYTVDQVMEMLNPAAIRLSPLGTHGIHADMLLDGSKDFSKGTLNVTRLTLFATPYSVSMSGKASLPEQPGQPAAPGSALTLDCRNCLTLIDDLSAYDQRARQVLMAFEPARASDPGYLPPLLAGGVKAFIEALATQRVDEKTKETIFTFALTVENDGSIVVNGKNMQDVMQLYAQHIVPNLPQVSLPALPEQPMDIPVVPVR